MRLYHSTIRSTALPILLAVAHVAVAANPAIDFNGDIRPILAAKCLACHGHDEDQREAELRLDDRQAALDHVAIVPGEPDESEMIRRIFSDDPDERMPPADTKDVLTDEQKELLRRWIAAGAKYEKHWSFVAPKKPLFPHNDESSWPRNGIDCFVLARLTDEGLEPSPVADRFSLVRRLYLDLIGLPPTPKQADEFVSNADPQAYEQLVDRLLNSEHYGERWAREWLDLARYADTNGYEKDRNRSIWPYRDWVIRAFNADMPFDQFTIEQLAGDMLPGATVDQIVATGFHRNTMLNEEGGIDPLEYRFYAMVDRVATTGTVWLGLTTGCAQCHTHKYDPITHSDYYRFMALLNNADEPDLTLKSADVAQRRRELHHQIEELENRLAARLPPLHRTNCLDEECAKFQKWLRTLPDVVTWTTLRPSRWRTNLPKLELLADGSIFSSGDITKRDVFTLVFQLDDSQLPLTAIRLDVLPDERLPAGGPGRAYYEGRKGDFFLSELVAQHGGAPVKFVAPSHSYGKISIGSGNAAAANVLDGNGSTGWSTAQREGAPHQLVLNLAEPITEPGELQLELLFERHFAASLGRFRFSAASSETQAIANGLPRALEKRLANKAEEWSSEDLDMLRQFYLRTAPEFAESRKPIDDLRKKIPAFPTTMVMHERPADNVRKTQRHHRGEYLSPKEEVTPGLPAFLSEATDKPPSNRLALARWLVSEENPLVARVTVNRAWQALFGTGLVRTSGDFGTQADPPTHPKLLDWLAREFVDQGWSMKRLHRLIVTSATYRQQSSVPSALLERDPQNELLTRGPRHRVSAEMVRDIMLHASGLLSPKMYGPSVRPPQPNSVTALAYGNPSWTASTGEDRYRRSLYTFGKRTAPFAAFTVFDAPSGEGCIARRDRSNSPLQALTLLNDEMYLEMSRALAEFAMNKASSENSTATYMFRRVLVRPPEPAELAAIVRYQRGQLRRLAAGELDADKIAGQEHATNAQAAWAMTARVVMNLDEAITKP